MKVKPWMVIVVLLLMGTTAWALERVARSKAEARAHTADSMVVVLGKRADSLASVYRADTVRLTQWRTRWDSIVGPGRTDTLTIERVIAVADTTIRACTAALSTCELRVAVANERADSAQSAAASWKRLARGPWLRPSLELSIAPNGWTPQAAAEVTLGRGGLKVLGRIEAGETGSTCEYVSTQEATVCSSTITAVGRVGVRYTF